MDRNVHAPQMLVRSRFFVKLTALGVSPVWRLAFAAKPTPTRTGRASFLGFQV